MKKIFFIFITSFIFFGTAYAEVSQFVFINEQRTVAPGLMSETITVQSQNSTGTQESITETTDLMFQSSSPTGEFLNSSGNSVSTTMSKNTANRTFYYRDNNTGTHTITVTATGRDSQKSFKATQGIIVGTSSAVDASADETSIENTSSVNTSSHSSPSPASGSKDIVSFEISAGRKRFSSVGSDIAFKAEPVKLLGIPENYIQYTWSFGDGTTANGQIVSHRYRFAGDYVVVLNASYSDKTAVSRTDVSVIEPVFELNVISGGIQVMNKSVGEINLGEWVIEGARNRLEIPKDTIIQKGKIITFSYNAIVADTDIVLLKNPLGVMVAEIKPVDKKEVKDIEVKQEVVPVVIQEPQVKIVYVERSIPKKELPIQVDVSVVPDEPTDLVEENKNNLVATVYQASPKVSALESLLWIPRKGWGILAGLFR
ncbi:MAG: PKD domain-containing protein [Minisyncoccota bacterium]